MQTNQKLDDVLMDAIGNTEKLNKIKGELEKDKGQGGNE
jgi:hypothetical protein